MFNIHTLIFICLSPRALKQWNQICVCVCVCVYDLFVNYFPADSDGSCFSGFCVIFDQSLASFVFFFLNVRRLIKQLFC